MRAYDKTVRRFLTPVGKNKTAGIAALAVGAALLVVFLLAAAAPSVFTDYSPTQAFQAWQSPSAEHILGTNDMGYDIFTELVYATRQTLLVGIASAAAALVVGTLTGLAASAGGIVGAAANGLINLFMMLPKLPVIIVLTAFLGGGETETVLVIAAFGWVTTARAVRAKAVHLSAMPFAEALTAAGYSPARITFRHILPNVGEVALTRYVSTVASSIMTEATLSFLGLGSVTSPTWGTMINFAYRRGAFVLGAYGWLLAPGAALMLLVLAFWCIWYFAESRSQEVSGGATD